MAAIAMKDFQHQAQALVSIGRQSYERGWVPATSGNFSVRLGRDELAITVSGRHKGRLTPDDIMRVDSNGIPLDNKRPSAETLLHVALYRRFPEVQAVLHTHSVNATVISRLVRGELVLEGMEVLKAFRDVATHLASVVVPVFPNDQDMARLSAAVEAWLDGHGPTPGYLIAGHGLYTWGTSLDEAMRHLEAFEFLFQCELEMRRITGS